MLTAGVAEARSLARYARHSPASLLHRRPPGPPRARSGPGERRRPAPPPPAASRRDGGVRRRAHRPLRQAPVIEAALARRSGRPRPLPVRAVLTALLCLAPDHRPLFLTAPPGSCSGGCPPASRSLPGSPAPPPPSGPSSTPAPGSTTASRHLLGEDPSPLPKNRCLTEQDSKPAPDK